MFYNSGPDLDGELILVLTKSSYALKWGFHWVCL